ncbi:DUF3263 domain-containing protein [Phytomonospora sp. NPDC050363]|uniref:DUF3263 domain-containing protein n=1 Tax=Phytomonospora sp. NPDC050363 TaxID=3155642 RepID=UPI0033D3718E
MPEVPAPRRPLSDEERALLAFEKRWWRRAGSKEQAIVAAFGGTVTRYYTLLGEMLDDPVALEAATEAEPAVVRRLLAAREERHRLR